MWDMIWGTTYGPAFRCQYVWSAHYTRNIAIYKILGSFHPFSFQTSKSLSSIFTVSSWMTWFHWENEVNRSKQSSFTKITKVSSSISMHSASFLPLTMTDCPDLQLSPGFHLSTSKGDSEGREMDERGILSRQVIEAFLGEMIFVQGSEWMRHGDFWGRGVPGRQNGRSKSLIRCATKQEKEHSVCGKKAGDKGGEEAGAQLYRG